MPASLIPTAIKAIGPFLAKNGLDVLASIFKGAPGKRINEVAAIIEKETGIDIGKAGEAAGLTDAELKILKDFELQNQDMLINHSEVIEQLELEGEKLRLADVANARAMQIAAMTSNDRFIRRFVPYFAIGLTVSAAAFIYGITFHIPVKDFVAKRDLINTILGFILGTTLSTVIGFYFGSSQGSARKGDQIAQLTSHQEERG